MNKKTITEIKSIVVDFNKCLTKIGPNSEKVLVHELNVLGGTITNKTSQSEKIIFLNELT